MNQRVDPVRVTVKISDKLHFLLFVSHVPKLYQPVSTATEKVALVLRLLVHDQSVDAASVRHLVGIPDQDLEFLSLLIPLHFIKIIKKQLK